MQRILKWIAIAAVGMAVLGLGQRAFGNGKFLWVYEHPSRDTLTAVKGVFTNQNHFAHFLALGIAPLILWIRSNLNLDTKGPRSSRSRKNAPTTKSQIQDIALIAGLCLVVLAGLLTFSRGGVATIFLTACTAVFGLAWIGMLSLRVVLSVTLAGTVVTAAIFIFGYQPLVDELNTVDQAQSMRDVLSVRLDLWNSMFSAAKDFPIFGTGAGSHRDVYPTFMNNASQVQFSHGESGFVQVAMETGLAGGAILLALFGILGFSTWRWFRNTPNPTAKACMIAALAGLFASAAHSFVDFVWYIPACFTLTVLLLALVCRVAQLDSDGKVETKRFTAEYPVAFTLGVGLLVLCVGLVQQRIGPGMASHSWDRYFALSKHAGAEERISYGNSEQEQQERRISELRIREMQRYLAETLRWDPNNSRAMVRLASLEMQQFGKQQDRLFASMPLDQIVDVVQNSEFESEAAKNDWLQSVLGDRLELLENAVKLSEQSLRLSPLEGRAYLLLAESGQLFGWEGDRRRDLLDQAKLARPFDELVQYKCAIEKMRAGDVDQAIDDWKLAFAKSPAIRSLAIDALAPIYTSEQLADLLTDDWKTLYELYVHYNRQNRKEDATFIAGPLAAKIESHAEGEPGPIAAQLLHQAGNVYAHLGQSEDAIRCLRKSTQYAPVDFKYRLALAKQLMKAEDYDDAVTQYKWCRRRDPKNETVATELEKAYRLAVTQEPVDETDPEPISRVSSGPI